MSDEKPHTGAPEQRPPESPERRAKRLEASAKGGKTVTPKKLAHLEKVHAKRRGKRVNKPGVSPAELTTIFEQLRSFVENCRTYRTVSLRACAKFVGVAPSTLTHWMQGVDTPNARAVKKIQNWIKTTEAKILENGEL